MTTIRKNSKRLHTILNRPQIAGVMFTLGNSFHGQPIAGQALRDWFLQFYDSIAVREGNNRITLYFHSNCWVEIED